MAVAQDDDYVRRKAAAMAELLTGAPLGRVSEAYGFNVGTLSKWRARYTQTLLNTDDAVPRPEIGDRLVRYLEASLETLTLQLQFFGDRTWLRRQDAASLARLHGVLADQTVRLLSSYQHGSHEASALPENAIIDGTGEQLA